MPRTRALASLLGLALAASASRSLADVPPPEGQTRVGYSFRVTGTLKDAVLIAYPMYGSDGSNVLELALDRDATPVQGYTPGIYSLSPADAAALKGKDDEAIKDALGKTAHVCVKSVPRVFAVATETRVTSLVDVFQVDASAGACRTSFAKTLYGGAKGEKGEGGIDTSGKRMAPAPFGAGLPPVGDLGFALDGKSAPAATSASPGPSATSAAAAPSSSSASTAASEPPAHGGCAGCSMASAPGGVTAGGIAFAIACGVARRRRRR